MLEKIIEYYCQGNHDGGRYETLTSREKEVLVLAREGLTNTQIARRLNISNRTVEAHRFHIMKKLNLRNLTELARYFIEESRPDYAAKS